MDNTKRNVHNSGPLGMLVKTGQVKKINLDEEERNVGNLQHVGLEGLKTAGSYFKTPSGINFTENELALVDPKECEPWEYANRSDSEMGNMDELIQSIRDNTQLQPALVRSHPNPTSELKYQIIFGRRRHAACLSLGIPFLVIKKDNLSLQKALAYQDAENKFRKDVSNYSNAMLYKKLLDNQVFKNDAELASSLNISRSSLSELLSFTRIPEEVINSLPNVHNLSIYLAAKISRLLVENPQSYQKLVELAPEIGKSITTPTKLEVALNKNKKNVLHGTKVVTGRNGKKLFTFKYNNKGIPSITFDKVLATSLDFELICNILQTAIETKKCVRASEQNN